MLDSRRPGRRAEYTARSVEEALEKAANDFGVPVSALQYEVLADRTRTILGIVRTGEVVVRAWVAEAAPTPAPAPAVEAEVETEEEEPEEEEPEEEEPAAEEEAVPPRRERAEQPSDGADHNPPEMRGVAEDVVNTLLDQMGIIAAVEVSEAGGELDDQSGEVSPMVFNVVGDDLGLLIGRRGETLRDLQFLVRLLVSRKLGVWPNLVLDVEGYKTGRAEALQALAKRVADQVRQTHQAVVLEPMPANERRIIHLTLRDDPDVYTESTGEDEFRKVQVLPK